MNGMGKAHTGGQYIKRDIQTGRDGDYACTVLHCMHE
jgi:hypothetical protein